MNHVGLFKCHSNVVYFTCFDPSAAWWCSRWASSVNIPVYIKGPVVMAGLDQALSGLASGQLQAIVAAAQCKLQAVPTTGSTSASAAVDVAVHDTKILFPPVFPMLPDMSNGRFPHPESGLARAGPGFGWLTDITARYLFKQTFYIWKHKRGGATLAGQTVFPWETTPLSWSDWQGWKVASVGLGTNGKTTFDAHQVQRLSEMWSHHGLGTVAPGGINTHSQSYGPKFWLKNKDEIDPDWHPAEGVQLTTSSVRKVGGTISTGGNKERLQGLIGELEVDGSEQPEKKQRRTMGASASASASAVVALPSATPAESMGMEAVVDESLHVLPSVIKQESQDEMMAPTAGPSAAPALCRCVMLYRFKPVLCTSNAIQMPPVWFKRDSSPACELRLNYRCDV